MVVARMGWTQGGLVVTTLVVETITHCGDASPWFTAHQQKCKRKHCILGGHYSVHGCVMVGCNSGGKRLCHVHVVLIKNRLNHHWSTHEYLLVLYNQMAAVAAVDKHMEVNL